MSYIIQQDQQNYNRYTSFFRNPIYNFKRDEKRLIQN
ncbi:unnamed protein product [Paramecium sonneborni]|uniref:Uncharacterized protein n=1 Tax=Paramecium sonneborni TaxID=65129 RepID=A0A8S1PQA0_9CILI|nr:unnamed protein product [Paramecium sonneborni]